MKINPVLLKEAKVRMRNWKAAGMIAIYVGILSFVALFILMNTLLDPYSSGITKEHFMIAYMFLAGIQITIISFIVPSLTSGCISGERERQTLDLLLCTKLSPSSIIIGKLFTSISQVLLLIVASLPIFSIIFLFGGISIGELLQLLLFYVVLTIMIGSIGIFFSTHLKRTTASTVLTYAVLFFLVVGTLIVTVFYYEFYIYRLPGNPVQKPTFPLLYINPAVAFIEMMAGQFGIHNGYLLPGINLGKLSVFKHIKFWHVNLIINFVTSIVLLTLSSIRLNPIKRRDNKGKAFKKKK
ncbi:ABC transporter permease [Clostridium ganghwense]|uniref:ABC transporter permease n=1 Tax=Clostridium ganghwense TaxID=312089 RepID=A0ABT4CRB8_9CLOT|nr:ABC transporter permease subunit [Clostridium ganghwense]MCY6371601.1 ABC transporter permease [Clostridium ganghwense]